MITLALDVWQDLRAKRLWPVALALVVVTVAVPILLLTTGREEPAPAPPAPSAKAELGSLVAPATEGLAGTSSLDQFKSRDPFAPENGGGRPESGGGGGDGAPDPLGGGTVDDAGLTGGGDVPVTGGGPVGAPSDGGTAGTDLVTGGSSGASGGTTSAPATAPSGDTGSTGGTGGGSTSGGSSQPPQIRYYADEVDLRVRKPDGDVITPTVRKHFVPLPEENPVVLFNGVGSLDGEKVVGFVVIDPAIVDRDDDSCYVPAGPATCRVFLLEEGQEQRIDVGAEHYTVSVREIRRVRVRGFE